MTRDLAGPTERPRRRVRYLTPLALVVAGGLGLTLWIVLSGAARPQGWQPHPLAWDDRVAPVARQVEQARGLTFQHPVSVEFLDDEAFGDYVTGELQRQRDESSLEEVAATLRAVGLVQGDIDLGRESTDLMRANVVGLYDPGDKILRIRGDDVSPKVRVTLAHELTHALQDQYFDLQAGFARMRSDPSGRSGTPDAYRGLVEGDAVRVQREYMKTLDDSERNALREGTAEDLRQVQAADVPEVLRVAQEIPYALGPAFVDELLRENGNQRVDEAFTDPPRSDADLLDPSRYLSGEVADLPPDPPLEEGEEELDRDTFGATDTLMTLGERVEPALAEKATAAYAGARMVLFERDDRTCLRASFRAKTDAGAADLAQAWSAWAAAMPPQVASVAADGGDVVVTSCDPGKDVTGYVTGNGAELLRKHALEPLFVRQLEDAGAPPNVARCIADGLMSRFSVEELTSAAAENSESLKAEGKAIAQRCRSAPSADTTTAP